MLARTGILRHRLVAFGDVTFSQGMRVMSVGGESLSPSLH